MPIEILETLANLNYNSVRPRPIDVASLYDLVKVRRLVDDATTLAVKAASDVVSSTLTNVNGQGGNSAFGFDMHPGHGQTKLSRERKFRMREQASQKLARAYRLDEIACSVATMQGASPLDGVGQYVLQRNAKDSDAKYVHFFHEKIPSREVAGSTSLQPLTDIISDRPYEPEALRTRATVKVFKEDYEGAAQDLTAALTIHRIHGAPHQANLDQKLTEPQRGWRRPDTKLAEKDQPSSLEPQLYFQRGTVYLSLACKHVADSLPPQPKGRSRGDETPPSPTDIEDDSEEVSKRQSESRKAVKMLGKRALRDFMTFISYFEYSPNAPISYYKDFNDRVNIAVQGSRHPRHTDPSGESANHKVYNLAQLFAAVAPSDIPTYPSQELVANGAQPAPETTCEATSYHPLLADALHSLLLAHCLVQTSSKELQRHSYMVARLIRLLDGYPIFQASRSPSRCDWTEVLRRADNWLSLSSTWESLCAPAPIPYSEPPSSDAHTHKSQPNPQAAASAAKALVNGESAEDVAEEARRESIRQQAIMEALNDERVVDEETFRAAIDAREKRAEDDHRALSEPSPPTMNGDVQSRNTTKRWSGDDARDYPILTKRAAAVALWVREAPIVTGTTRRKKKVKKPAASMAETEKDMGALELADGAEG